MPIYLISFEKGAMDHIPDGDWDDVRDASRAAVQEAKDAGVYRFAGGLSYDDGDVQAAVVGMDGMITDGPFAEGKEFIGGVLVVDVPSRDDALKWAAKVAAACRCAQDVRKFIDDPES
jgi:hypothetical protein